MVSFIVHYQTHFHSATSSSSTMCAYCTFGWLKYVRQYCFGKSNIFANTLKLSGIDAAAHLRVATDENFVWNFFPFPSKNGTEKAKEAWLVLCRRKRVEEHIFVGVSTFSSYFFHFSGWLLNVFSFNFSQLWFLHNHMKLYCVVFFFML